MKVFLLGDWGSKTSNQRKIASSMDKDLSSSSDYDAVFALGDNFYEVGVSSTSDSQWTSTWKDVYSSNVRSIPWNAILGNHDYYSGTSGVEAQVDRSLEHINDDTWYMPDKNYTLSYTLSGGKKVHFVFLDTPTLAPNADSCCSHASDKYELQEEQLLWAESTLSELSSRHDKQWLVVVGHYPVFSVGSHGDNSELKDKLQPLMETYGVDLYISGHDHISEHLYNSNIHYMVAGAAAKTASVQTECKTEASNIVWTQGNSGSYAVMEANNSNIWVSFKDVNGNSLYTATLPSTPSKTSKYTSSNAEIECWIVDNSIAFSFIVIAAVLVIAGVSYLMYRHVKATHNASSNSDNEQCPRDESDAENRHDNTTGNTSATGDVSSGYGSTDHGRRASDIDMNMDDVNINGSTNNGDMNVSNRNSYDTFKTKTV